MQNTISVPDPIVPLVEPIIANAPLNGPLKAALSVRPQIVRRADAPKVEFPGECATVLLSAAQTGGALGVGALEVTPDGGPPLHRHSLEDEIFVIQSGAFEFFANGQFVRAGAGDVVFAPRGEVHNFRGLECGMPNRFSIFISPAANFEAYFPRWAQYVVSPEFSLEGAIALNAEHGIDMFAPDAEIPLVENGQTRLVRSHEMPLLDVTLDRVRVALSSEQTGGAYALCQVESEPGSGPPPHIHSREDETFLIESGEYEFWIDGETHRVGAGDLVWGPRGVPHTFRVVGDTPGIMWVLMTPGGFDNCFAAMSEEVRKNGFSPVVAGQICDSFGCQFLPPAE